MRMEMWREILDPDFLLRNSVYMSVLVGFACPLVGTYLLLRRLIFMGVALPHISSCGIAFAFAFHTWGLIPHMEEGEHTLALAGSTIFTLGAILGFSWFEKRGRSLIEASIGTAYVLAGAWSILLLVKNPHGEHGLLDRLKGEIIAVSNASLGWTFVVFAIVALTFFIFQKEFLLVSFDRETAVTLKKNVDFWNTFLFLLIGLTISVSVLSVGPLVTFGFLLLPPLIAHGFASNMRQFIWGATAIGGVSALVGFYIAYRWDLPVGPTDVALLGVVYVLSTIVNRSIALRPATAHKSSP